MTTKEATPGVRASTSVLRPPNPFTAGRADWAQLVRFCLVGASGYVVNLAVFVLLVDAGGVHYIPAAIVTFCIAWANNFAWNKHWTFRRHGLSALHQGLRSLLVSVACLGLNLLMLHVLVSTGAGELPSQATAIVLVTPISFLLNRRWTFQ